MKKLLISKYGYLESNITFLRDDVSDALKSQLPTASNIMSNLKDIIAQSEKCEQIFVHYSGHGSKIKDMNNDEKSGYDSVIVPMDYPTAGVIVDDIIFSYIRESKCPTLTIFDSCNSGTVVDLPYSFMYDVSSKRLATTSNNNYKLSNPNIYSISGCRDDQYSADAYQDGDYGGALTDAFLKCLETGNFEGSLQQIYIATFLLLIKQGFPQRPVLSCSSASTSNFVFKKVSPATETVAVAENNSTLAATAEKEQAEAIIAAAVATSANDILSAAAAAVESANLALINAQNAATAAAATAEKEKEEAETAAAALAMELAASAAATAEKEKEEAEAAAEALAMESAAEAAQVLAAMAAAEAAKAAAEAKAAETAAAEAAATAAATATVSSSVKPNLLIPPSATHSQVITQIMQLQGNSSDLVANLSQEARKKKRRLYSRPPSYEFTRSKLNAVQDRGLKKRFVVKSVFTEKSTGKSNVLSKKLLFN
jgi:hypothetical protein